MDPVLSAVAHPTRRRVVEVLLQGGSLKQIEIADRLELLEGSLSKQMAILTRAGLVERPSARGPWSLPYPAETLRLLQAAADLDEVITASRAARSHDTAQRLRSFPDATGRA